MGDRENSNMHVLVAGGGIVGLTLAQGLREAKIPFTIFERDLSPTTRSQGWALTFYWCLAAFERIVGPRLSALLPKVLNPFPQTPFFFLFLVLCEPLRESERVLVRLLKCSPFREYLRVDFKGCYEEIQASWKGKRRKEKQSKVK
jgi:hypothetical protein